MYGPHWDYFLPLSSFQLNLHSEIILKGIKGNLRKSVLSSWHALPCELNIYIFSDSFLVFA